VEPLFFVKRKNPHAPAAPTVETLAREIDWLERHVDHYGTIVAKHPDIWGESRLTKHRAEFERMMFEQLNQFTATINATQFRSDQAYLQSALAISAAAGGNVSALNAQSSEDKKVEEQKTATINVLEDIDELKSLLPEEGKIALNQSELKSVSESRFRGLNAEGKGIALEPVTFVDQLKTYLDHLHELRRINEGDDTSDSPGYALNLVRIPISVLPGKHTQRGYGAEITITATPVLSDALLPTTFRNLVINDLVDQLGLPVTRLAEFGAQFATLEAALKRLPIAKAQHVAALERVKQLQEEEKRLVKEIAAFESSDPTTISGLANKAAQGDSIAKENLTKQESLLPKAFIAQSPLAMSTNESYLKQRFAMEIAERKSRVSTVTRELRRETQEVQVALAEAHMLGRELSRLEQLAAGVEATAPNPSMSRSRRARYGVVPTQLNSVFGPCELRSVAMDFYRRYAGRDVRWAGKPEGPKGTETRVHLLDVQRYLQAEIDAAYELLKKHPQLMMDFVGPNDEDLAKLIRGGHMQRVCEARNTFLRAIRDTYQRLEPIPEGQGRLPSRNAQRGAVRPVAFEELQTPAGPPPVEAVGSDPLSQPPGELAVAPDCQCPPYMDGPECDPHLTTTEALAWAILVECALLNDQLIDDMRRTAQSKECHCLDGGPLPYYLPEPPQAACDSFKEYVRCRWPIIVFALDPTALQQNVADAYSRKRELQLALAVGFASGEVSARNLTRYVRRLETDIETITLNQTITGFSHGSDTFGWRFFPRVQPPPFQSNATVFFRDLIGGGPTREADRAQLELETGMRECVAIVLMPSFVPYIDFDTRSNWFCLNQRNGLWPWRSQTEISMADTMKLSRSIKSMHTSAQTVCDGGLYRDGETTRLLRRVEQLDKELPLQTMRAQIPYENTLGGFEMFNTGLTDLAPELAGWYGAPGILVSKGAATCDPGQPSVASAAAGSADCACADGKRPFAVPFPICEGVGTTIFLVGDNFSVHDTKVIAGATCIPHFQLVSRQIMQVTIPACVQTVNVDDEDYVAVHVATPYGVTSHLHIPVTRPTTAPTAAQVDAATRDLVREEFVQLQPATNSKLALTPDTQRICALYTMKPPGAALEAVRIDESTTKIATQLSNRFQTFYKETKGDFDANYLGNLGAAVDVLDLAAFAVIERGGEFEALGELIPLGKTEFKKGKGTVKISGDPLHQIEEQLAKITGLEAGSDRTQIRLIVSLNVPGGYVLSEVSVDLKPFCDPCPTTAATAPPSSVSPVSGPAECDNCRQPEAALSDPRSGDLGKLFNSRIHRPMAFTAGMVPRPRPASRATFAQSDSAARSEITPLPPVYPVAGSAQHRAVVHPQATAQRNLQTLVLPTAPRPRLAEQPATVGAGVRRR